MKEEKFKSGNKLVDLIINNRKTIEILFVIFFVISVFLSKFVVINYDFTKYLPKATQTIQGIDVMKKEFGYPGTARVMIKGVSLYEAKDYKQKIEKIDGVDDVIWADTLQDVKKYTDIYTSREFIKEKDIEDYYKNKNAIMDITFKEDDYADRTSRALDQIKEIIGDKGRYGGPAFENKSLTESLNKEMKTIMIFVVLIVSLILLITTTSWFETLIFMLIMGVAIIINTGTNVFIGSVSFLTSSVAPVLQLAVAMDYSIFLVHSFTAEKKSGAEPLNAIAAAIRHSIYPIISCGVATIIGFIALTLMKFTIGFDLGVVLAKGIFISLLTVLFLMPCLIMRWSKYIEKTAHRPFIPPFTKASKWIFKIRYVVLVLAIVIAIPSYLGKDMNDFLFGNAAVGAGKGTKVYNDEQEMNSKFGKSNLFIALVPNTSSVKEKQLSDELDKLSYVRKISSLAHTLENSILESMIPNRITKKFHTDNYARILIYIRSGSESEGAFKCSDEISKIIKKYYPKQSYLVGTTPFTQDLKTTITSDYSFVDLLSLLGVALVAMIVFRSILIPILLVIPIEFAIFVNMVFPYLVGEKMIFIGYIIVSCIQLAATVDYAILMTDNYLKNRLHMNKKEAVIHTLTESAPPILNSGIILASSGYTLYKVSTIRAIGDMGHLIGRGALFGMIMVVFLYPSLLYIFDKPINNHIQRMERFRASSKAKAEAMVQKAKSALNI